MTCPYCGADLLGLAWKYWSGKGSERFELICPECGNNVIVVARLSLPTPGLIPTGSSARFVSRRHMTLMSALVTLTAEIPT